MNDYLEKTKEVLQNDIVKRLIQNNLLTNNVVASELIQKDMDFQKKINESIWKGVKR